MYTRLCVCDDRVPGRESSAHSLSALALRKRAHVLCVSVLSLWSREACCARDERKKKKCVKQICRETHHVLIGVTR